MLHIRDAVAELVDDLAGHEDKPEPATQSDAKADEQMPLAQINKTEASLSRRVTELPERWRTKTPVLCVPGSGLLDEAVALILQRAEPRPMRCRCRAFSVWIQMMSRWCAFAMWKMQLRRRFAMRSGACAEKHPMHSFS